MANFELSHKGLEFLHVWRWVKHTRQKGHCVKSKDMEETFTLFSKKSRVGFALTLDC